MILFGVFCWALMTGHYFVAILLAMHAIWEF